MSHAPARRSAYRCNRFIRRRLEVRGTEQFALRDPRNSSRFKIDIRFVRADVAILDGRVEFLASACRLSSQFVVIMATEGAEWYLAAGRDLRGLRSD